MNICLYIIKNELKRNLLKILLLILLCFLGALFPSITPLVYRQIVDELIPGKDYLMLFLYVLILIAIPVCTSLLFNWRNIYAHRMSEIVTQTLRMALFEKISKMDYTAFSKMGSKSLVYRLTRSCGQVGDIFLKNTMISAINASFSILLVLIPMMLLEWHLALIVLSAFPIVYCVLAGVKKHVASKDKKLMQVLMEGEGLFHEALEGIRVMKLSGGEKYQTEKVKGWLKKHFLVKETSVKAHEFERVSLPELCLQILYGMVFVMGALLVMTDNMTIGELVAFIAYIPRALGSIKELLLIQVTYKSVEPYFMSLNEVFEISDEVSGVQIPENVQNRIQFRNVNFSYHEESKFNLQNINFEVLPNEAVAIVGESGGGKSTLLDLILRFFDATSGQILLNGVNIREYEINTYRALFAVVQQNHFLWSDTLRANIIYPEEQIRQDKYDMVIEKTQLTEFIENLSQKDQTLLGERGQAVSGGERQRISLAHALYQERPYLLLDEPTSALDAETEARVSKMISDLKGKKTIITVTHRLSTVFSYDRVLVVKNGTIVESGTPNELLKHRGVFYSMCEQQGILHKKERS